VLRARNTIVRIRDPRHLKARDFPQEARFVKVRMIRSGPEEVAVLIGRKDRKEAQKGDEII
jgi:hypothetical protein